MGFIHRYSLKQFMTPYKFFYPRLVIDFYQTMTSRGERHPTALHFTINARQGVLRAADIPTAFQLPMAISNSADFQWLFPIHIVSAKGHIRVDPVKIEAIMNWKPP